LAGMTVAQMAVADRENLKWFHRYRIDHYNEQCFWVSVRLLPDLRKV
jgi:hypothetical protein